MAVLRVLIWLHCLLPLMAWAEDKSDVVITDAELVSTLLPPGGSIVRQNSQLDGRMIDWLEQQYRFRPAPQALAVWLSREPESGRILGGMIKMDVIYQQQKISLAIGLSHELRVSRAAVVAVPPALRQRLQATIGVGYLPRYTMMSARQLGYLANVLQKEGQPTALVAESLFKYGAMLAAVIKLTE